MRRPTTPSSAVDRSRWLAALAEALEQAQKMSWQLGLETGKAEALELYSRLEAVRLEVELLQLGHVEIGDERHSPYWIKLPPKTGHH